MTETVEYEVYAIAFARNDAPTRGHLMLGAASEPHDEPMPLSYYAWLIRSGDSSIVVDAGFTAKTNGARPRRLIERPGQAIARLGVDPAKVATVILSHFHNDHVGDLDAFGSATFIAQRAEYEYWTGPDAFTHELSKHAERSDIERLVELHEAGRLQLVEGTAAAADGVTVHPAPGHTPGMQVTVVRTASGPVVLASDAAHFFEVFEQNHLTDVNLDPDRAGATVTALHKLAEGGLLIAGHDPQLVDRYPAVTGLEGRALRIA